MGRLFWKMFLGFWLSLVLAAGGVGVAVWLYQQAGEDEPALGAARGGFAAGMVGSVLRHGGPLAAREMLEDWHRRGPRTRVFVVDERGAELLGRAPPDAGAAQAAGLRVSSLAIGGADGRNYQVISLAPPREPGGRRVPERPSPLLPLAAGLLASLAFSGLMAWLLARPVRQLRGAFSSLGEGRLETRVGDRMGAWRDEIVDLGGDFDRMARQLEAQVSAQRRLLHDVSHELRSPLARLQAAIGLARQSPARTAELLERVERECARLDQLVGELLTLARLDAAAGDVARERLDLFDLVAGVAADAAFEAELRGVRLDCQGSGEAPVEACGAQLQRAFENVMRNAVKFSPAGALIEVRAERHGAWFRATVGDRGPGVPAGEIERIFEPFFRSAANGGEGFGLGLAIARRAVAADGGSVRAANRPGGGLEVVIELPVPADVPAAGARAK